MSALLSSLAAIGLSVLCAVLLGWTLGRLAASLTTGGRLMARLIELRGALPTLIMAPVLDGWLHLPAPVTVGLVVGVYQALALARWTRAVAGPGLEQPGAAPELSWLERWKVPAETLIALCVVHVVTLEAILSMAQLPPFTVSLGSLMAQAFAPGVRIGVVLVFTCLFLLFDHGTERLGRVAARGRIQSK